MKEYKEYVARRQEQEGKQESQQEEPRTFGEKLKLKIAKLATNIPVKWKRCFSSLVPHQEEDPQGEVDEAKHAPKYESRMIRCTRCQELQETKRIQLHTPQGFRDIHCRSCGRHERCLYNLCQCKVIWHQCPTHRFDPGVHASRKGLKRAGDEKTKAKEEKKLSSLRKAPDQEGEIEVKSKRRRQKHKKKGGGQEEKNNHQVHCQQ